MAPAHIGDVNLLLTTLGHDLRGPLSVLMLANDLMAKADEAPSSALLARLRRSTERMSDLISEITQFVRLRFGEGLRPRPEAIDAASLFGRVAARVASAYPRRQEVHFTADPCVFAVDPQLVELAICGAICDRLDAGGNPAVRARANTATIDIEIADNGPVVDVADPVSEPSRAHLGLYLAAEIARAHGGSAACQSTAGSTTFVLQLPRWTG